jgi:GAF domain-containing protein
MRGHHSLIQAIDLLSSCRDLAEIMAVSRRAARAGVHADGATFVLRDGDEVFYADEDAIGPLWKGRRFPITACISGWSMLHRSPIVIPDVYYDDRIPIELYRPTFVKSLIMVPIHVQEPVGAIGTYWAVRRWPSDEEVELLQSLAHAASLALQKLPTDSSSERSVSFP